MWPARATTATITSSSVSSLGTPYAAASRTAGCSLIDFFDLEGGDVLAATADAVGAPPDEVEVAVGVLAGQIAGVEPQVTPRFQASPGHAVVAVGHQRRLIRTNDDLSDLADPHLRAGFVEESDVVLRNRPPTRALSSRLVDRVVHRDAGVGRAVQLHQLDPEALLEVVSELGHGYTPPQAGRILEVVGSTGRLCSMVNVAPMKSKTVAPARRTSSQNPDAENRSPIAAVVASNIAGTTVSTVASMWNIGNGQ